MSDQARIAEVLRRHRRVLPPKTIVKTEGGTVACRFYDHEHGVVFCDDRPFKWSALATELPAIVLWSPEVDR